jgi:transposase
VPQKILFDNPKTVTLRDVAGAAVSTRSWCGWRPTTAFGRRRRPFYDAPSNGKAEALGALHQSDLIPHGGFSSLDEANTAARTWLAEVNAQPHSETKRPPVELLEAERTLSR